MLVIVAREDNLIKAVVYANLFGCLPELLIDQCSREDCSAGAAHGCMQLKQLSKVVVRFSPWQENARSAREFLSRCLSPSASKSNPDCKVQICYVSDARR